MRSLRRPGSTRSLKCALTLAGVCGLASCAADFDTTRRPEPRKTVGEDVFGMLCDRVGAGALHEDLTGESYKSICHGQDGVYGAGVDERRLPRLRASGDDEVHKARRDAIRRVEAMAKHRAELIAAINAVFPDTESTVRHLRAVDGEGSGGVRRAPHLRAVSDMLTRLVDLYNDGTIPSSTRALADLLRTIAKDEAALKALSSGVAQEGSLRAGRGASALGRALSYPDLRDATFDLVRLFSTDADPYDNNKAGSPPRPHRPSPGAERPALLAWLSVVGEELRSLTTDNEGPPAPSGADNPRGLMELIEEILLHYDPSFGEGRPTYITRLDERGAAVSLDVRRTLGAWLLRALPALLDNNSDTPGALTATLDALPALLGPRAPATKIYRSPGGSESADRDVTITYSGFQADRAPAVDLVYAIGQILGDRSSAEALTLLRSLAEGRPALLARLVAAARSTGEIAERHGDAELPEQSTLWDELLDQAAAIAQEPGLLEGVIRALGARESLAVQSALPKYLRYADRIGYDPEAINGPPLNFTTNDHGEPRTPVNRALPNTGFNRSLFQRFLALVHDTSGVAACSKAGALLNARVFDGAAWVDVAVPVEGAPAADECAFNKVDDLARFYLDSIVGKARLTIRMPFLAQMLSPEALEASTGLSKAFLWPSNEGLWPRPELLHRIVFFDLAHDSPTPEGKNYRTHRFLEGMFGGRFGTRVCAARTILDPAASGSSDDFDKSDIAPDGLVHNLQTCAERQWLPRRDSMTLFALEQAGGLTALAPLVGAFAAHNRQDLLLSTLEVLHRHWQDATGPIDECDPDDKTGARTCTQDGLNHFEPMLADVLESEAVPALNELITALEATPFGECKSVDPATKSCLAFERDGVDVLAEAIRGLVDPARAKAAGLRDRNGRATAARVDGGEFPQVTPLLLMRDALRAADAAFGVDPEKRRALKEGFARVSNLFLSVKKDSDGWSFADPATPIALRITLDALSDELNARCPASFKPPYAPCRFAREELHGALGGVIAGPLLASSYDIVRAIRRDKRAWGHLHGMARHTLDPAGGEGYDALVAAVAEGIASLRRAQELKPVLRALAPALVGGAPGEGSPFIDTTLVLLSRLNGRAFDAQGAELYAREADPNDIFPGMLARLFTPMRVELPGPSPTLLERTPFEAFTDAFADVNRATPSDTSPLAPADLRRITGEVVDFLTNRERGLEQLYVILSGGQDPR